MNHNAVLLARTILDLDTDYPGADVAEMVISAEMWAFLVDVSQEIVADFRAAPEQMLGAANLPLSL